MLHEDVRCGLRRVHAYAVVGDDGARRWVHLEFLRCKLKHRRERSRFRDAEPKVALVKRRVERSSDDCIW